MSVCGCPVEEANYHQWLSTMRILSRLPGGMPSEYRRKFWLIVAHRAKRTRHLDRDVTHCFEGQVTHHLRKIELQIDKVGMLAYH